ncbi:rac GTPase-activating protein 1 [Drosophila grimshawi]|uniref:Rac GTPase-activating protein 1 n=1 Tax=Drosophila grimshawi TaxID=7222 RepID=B4J591_DROGR|nr:rac GTPase-activating protein 1 [Drosophila grimshawi]EDW00717.1 GH20864 [Drosophila grimshawi]
MTLSVLASFDDLRRCMQVMMDGNAEEEFLRFLRLFEQYNDKCHGYATQNARLQTELDKSLAKMGDLEGKLYHARRIIDTEIKSRRQAEHERDAMEHKIMAVADLLRHERNLNNETRDKLAFLNTLPSGATRKRKSLNTLHEDKSYGDINSTGSLLSDLSITHSEDDFLDVRRSKSWYEHRPSLPKNPVPCVGNKRSRLSGGGHNNSNIGTPTMTSRRSGGRVDQHTLDVGQGAERFCATTKVTIPQDGQGIIRAESTIQSLPGPIAQVHIPAEVQSSSTPQRRSTVKEPTAPPQTPHNPMAMGSSPAQNRLLMRKHSFSQKTFLRGDNCVQCQKRIRFGSVGLRCRDCPVRCHIDCRFLLTVACVPQSGTPTAKTEMHYLSDFAPTIAPMIPALIVHCVNEIEARGLTEVGLYRMSSSEREYKALKEQFLRGKVTPHLGNTDIYVLCCCVKDFLRTLREPLIPTSQWKDFANAVQNPDNKLAEQLLYKAVEQMPPANRDTMAFLMLHFQRIADCPVVMMPIDNISKIFGPTIMGYSSRDPDQHALYTEAFTQSQVIKSLLELPGTFWQKYLAVEPSPLPSSAVKRAPSNNRDLFSLYATPLKGTMKKRKFYATPPISAHKK